MHTYEDSSGCELQLGHSLGESSANGVIGFFLFSSLSFFLSRRKNTNKHGVTATLTVAVRDKFIVGLMVRQVNVYVTVNWWAHATISTEWRMTDY